MTALKPINITDNPSLRGIQCKIETLNTMAAKMKIKKDTPKVFKAIKEHGAENIFFAGIIDNRDKIRPAWMAAKYKPFVDYNQVYYINVEDGKLLIDNIPNDKDIRTYTCCLTESEAELFHGKEKFLLYNCEKVRNKINKGIDLIYKFIPEAVAVLNLGKEDVEVIQHEFSLDEDAKNQYMTAITFYDKKLSVATRIVCTKWAFHIQEISANGMAIKIRQRRWSVPYRFSSAFRFIGHILGQYNLFLYKFQEQGLFKE